MSLHGTVNYHVHKPGRQAFEIDVGGIVGNIVSPEFSAMEVALTDLRDGSASAEFEGDGFAFKTLPSAVGDFEAAATVWTETYDRELKDLLRREIGAREVIVFDHTVRVDDPNAKRRPARHVHSDYSPDGAEQRLVDILGAETAAEWSKGRYAFINIWRPVGAAINSAPLGFVRPSTVKDEDWIEIDLIYPDRRGRIMGLAAGDGQEWVYLSRMTPDEVVYFNIYDSSGRPPVGHSAIDLVEDPGVKTIRKSIESRTLVRFQRGTRTKMLDRQDVTGFPRMNRAYNTVFQPDRLSIGLVLPLDAHGNNPVPDLARHMERAKLADELGFAALWLRDVPFNVPSFGDAGQIFDPFVYLGALAASTHDIALGVASVVLPLRHPAHVAKAAASADVLSGGRLLLGVASGDRPEEYPALNMEFGDRGERFRDSVAYIRAMAESHPRVTTAQGSLAGGIDMLPKPEAGQLPLLITGGSRQSPEWVARNGDGWMTYPRDTAAQAQVVDRYRRRIVEAGLPDRPVMQSLYVDLVEQADTPPKPIHLGFRSGTDYLRHYLDGIRKIGINHVALNLRFNGADMETTLRRLAQELLPEFNTGETRE